MSYADSAAMQDFLPMYVFSGSSKPSLAQIEKFCQDYSAKVDSVLQGRGYGPLPIIAPQETLDFLAAVTKVGVGFHIMRILAPSATSGLVMELRDEWNSFMAGMLDGSVKPPGIDAPYGSSDLQTEISYYSEQRDIDAQKPFIKRSTSF